jgi:hypothetical protein
VRRRRTVDRGISATTIASWKRLHLRDLGNSVIVSNTTLMTRRPITSSTWSGGRARRQIVAR